MKYFSFKNCTHFFTGTEYITLLLLIIKATDGTSKLIHGKYTENIKDYHLAVPHKATVDGEFLTFHLPHFHDPDPRLFKKRRKRELSDPDMVNYGLFINDELNHIELWPNREIVHPHIIIERRDPTVPLTKRDVKGMGSLKKMCYYIGRVRGIRSSRAAISTCDGLAGTISIEDKTYIIEPVHQHSPNAEGHHLHVVYDSHPDFNNKDFCAVNTDEGQWEQSIKERLSQDYVKDKILFKKSATTYEVVPQWIQMMVTGDKGFIEKHKGKRDILQWILTIMNMVRDFYADETMTAIMTPVIVRIILLEKEEEEIDLDITQDIDKSLKSFCKWSQKLQQPQGDSHHFDTSLLLSHWDFCHANGKCAVQGIAPVGNACGAIPCQLNEDKGFLTGLSVAHEQGHLLGMIHDNDPPKCPNKDPKDDMFYLMGPSSETLRVKWSPCSTAMMKELAYNHFLDCLNDEPPDTDYVIPDGLAGVTSNLVEQCNFLLPNMNFTDTCRKEKCYPLYCISNGKCLHFNADVVDGTPCGDNKWCFKRECVARGYRPEAVDGGWGEWTEWTKCSRTCGKGIQRRERFCDNPKPANRGKYCLGERNSFKICILDDCPDDQPSFREQQCKNNFNAAKFGGVNITKDDFVAANIVPETPCRLVCIFMDNGERATFNVLPSVDDGTICVAGSPNNICISGVCKDVGCDGKLDAHSVEDRCGICNGDGTLCKVVTGTWTSPSDIAEYTKIVDIPAGASKIEIEENTPSENFVALGKADGSAMYINGNNTISLPGSIPVGTKRMWVFYSGGKAPVEKITVDRAKEDLGFFMLWGEENPTNYTYKWVEPSDEPTYEPKYSWDTDEYEQCDALCGGGSQLPKFHCTEEKSGKVSNKFCEKVDKPKMDAKKCNGNPCPTEWKVGQWGRCRACKKKGGVRIRAVECVKKNPKAGADGIIQEDSQCHEPKPGSVELCETLKKCTSRRKRTYHIPGKYQEIVWKQMKKLHLVKRAAAPTIVTQKTRTFPQYSTTKRISSTRYTQAEFTGSVKLPRIGEIIVDESPDIEMVEVEHKVDKTGNLTEQDEKLGLESGTKIELGTTKIIHDFMKKLKCESIKLSKEKLLNRSKLLNSSSNPIIKQSVLTESLP